MAKDFAVLTSLPNGQSFVVALLVRDDSGCCWLQ